MKRIIIMLVGSLMISVCYAQNSTVEQVLASQSKTERFIKNAHYYQWEQVYSSKRTKGIEFNGYIYTNLETLETIGCIEVFTENKFHLLGLINEPSVRLGYIDMTDVQDLIKALNRMKSQSSVANVNDFAITYENQGGLRARYSSSEDKFWFSKERIYYNSYGTACVTTIVSPEISAKALNEIIYQLDEAYKMLVSKNVSTSDLIFVDSDHFEPIQINRGWDAFTQNIADNYNHNAIFLSKYDLNNDNMLSEDELLIIDYYYITTRNANIKMRDGIFDSLLKAAKEDYNDALIKVKSAKSAK